MPLGEVVGHLLVGGHHVFVGPAGAGHDVEVGAQFDRPGGDVGVQATALEGREHRLEDHAPQRGPVGLLLGFTEAPVSPVHGVRLGQAPLERAVFVVDLLHDGGHELELVDHHRDPVADDGRVGLQQGGVVGPSARDHILDLAGPAGLVGHVGVIEIGAHLVLIDPAQFPVHQGLVRIVPHALVTQQFDGPLHPQPPVFRVRELHRDVVGHVPRLMDPDAGEMRLQFGDPVGQLHGLEVLAVFLQFGGPDPQGVGDEPAEAAQRHGGEGQDRRSVADDGRAREAEGLAVAIQRALQEVGREERRDDDDGEDGLSESHQNLVGAASSRRVSTTMPTMEMPPPTSTLITMKARTSSNQVMLRPVLRLEMGE